MGLCGKLPPYPTMARMTSWRTQLVVAVLALSLSPAGAQSLGDVARSERERRARMAHHAPMLTDEDLRRDQILKKAPQSDSALPSPENGTSTNPDESLPLGDYARALRQRRLAEPTPAANAAATGPAPEPQPTAAATIAPEPQPAAAAAQKTTSLGDLAREVRAEREAARRVRIQEKKAAHPDLAEQKAAQPAAQVSKSAGHADKATHAAKAAPQTAHAVPAVTASPKPAQLTEVAAKPSAPPAPKAAAQKLAQQNAAPPAVQASKNAVHADKATHAPQTAHTVPTVTATVKPKQLTEVAAKPSVQPPLQPRAALGPEATDGQTIRVPRGASLWTLARRYLGAGRLWTALWKANPQIQNPDRIRAGQLLRCPVLDDQDNPTHSAGL